MTTPVTAAVVPPVRSSQPDRIVLYGIFALLLFCPLAFGTTEPWSVFILESVSALLLMFWIARQIFSGELSITWNPLFAPMLAFGFCIALQLATGRTAYRYQTFSVSLLYAAYGTLCFLSIQVLRRTSQVRTLATGFSAYGFLLALFAMLQGFSGTSRLYWLRTPRMGGWIYGPYVNHNHYAGLMEMLLPVPLVFCLMREAHGPKKIAAGIASALMAGTIFLSGSRGGMLAFVVQIALLSAVVFWRHKSRKVSLALATFLVLGFGLILFLGGTELSKRLATIHAETRIELTGGTRLNIDRDALKMFAAKPFTGWGLGVFPTVYPKFRSFPSNFFINQAHNDYLQLLVEMGGLGFAVLLWFLWELYRNCVRKLKNWSEDTNGALALATLLGVTGILVHSLVDFNLQIPANAALFYVLCVLAAVDSRFGKTRRKKVRHLDLIAELPIPEERTGHHEPIPDPNQDFKDGF